MPASARSGWRISTRGAVLLAILAAGLAAALILELSPAALVPSEGGFEIARRFFAGAFRPALEHEAAFVPEGARPILGEALDAAVQTLMFAAAAMSLAIPAGLALGFVASTAWWTGDRADSVTSLRKLLRRGIGPLVYGATRVLIAFMRSIHELIWAVLFLCAMGLSATSAVVAIAIPYAGTLAKIYSEMIDEAPRDAALALRGAGATPVQTFFVGLLPRALPDMTAYTFYRFECALRSSAILGFFGYPTLGLSIKLSYENSHYREVWTYLYTLFLLVVAVEWWSGALRRRFVA